MEQLQPMVGTNVRSTCIYELRNRLEAVMDLVDGHD